MGVGQFVSASNFPEGGSGPGQRQVKDVISDFQASGAAHDYIAFSTSLSANWTSLQASIADSTAGAVITVDALNTITLTGIAKATLTTNHVSDFPFA